MIRTTPYHHQSNGVVEGCMGPWKQYLLKPATRVKIGKDMPLAVLALWQGPNQDTGFSPYQLVYGQNVRTPLDLLYMQAGRRRLVMA